MSFRAARWGGLVALALGCGEGYQEPSPHTSPAVDVAYPHYYLTKVNPNLDSVTFGEASADLPVTIVGLEEDGRDHVLDFGLPKRASMRGYGAYEGMTEHYHRTRLVDSHGVHGVRVSVYRTDSARGHTNVWSHFLARSETRGIFLTEQTQWDWIGGEEDTSGFSEGAWPFYGNLQYSHYFYDSFFGFTPGIYSRSDFIRQVILSTKATSPTYGVDDCVQVLFNANDPALRHQAFLNERHGLVEVVYRWHDLDGETAWDYPLVPIDGFATPLEALPELPAPAETSNDLSGVWVGELTVEGDETMSSGGMSGSGGTSGGGGTSGSGGASGGGGASGSDGMSGSDAGMAGEGAGLNEGGGDGMGGPVRLSGSVRLEFSPRGLHYRALSNSYDVEGTYEEGDLDVHVRGRFQRDTDGLTLLAGRTDHLIRVVGLYYPFEGNDGVLAVRVFSSIDGVSREATGLLYRGAAPNEPDPNEPDPNEPDPNEPDPNEPDPNEPDPVGERIHVCIFEEAVDYPGNDQSRTQGGGAGDKQTCCQRAIAEGARYFQTTGFDECFLKSSRSAPRNVDDPSYVAGTVYHCDLEVGVDYPGNDLGPPLVGSGDAEACCRHAIEQGASYFQTTAFDECFLKSSQPASSKTQSSQSYVAGRVGIGP